MRKHPSRPTPRRTSPRSPSPVPRGGAISNSRRLEIKESYTESACLWALNVGRPGTGKSTPLMDFVAGPFYLAEDKWESAPARGKRESVRRCLVEDTTLEAAVRVMAANPRGALMVQDELAAFLAGLNQNKKGARGNDLENYLKTWNGSPWTCDRVYMEGVPIKIPRPFLTIVGGIPPDVLLRFRAHRQEIGHVDDGFLDRFLFSFPDKLPATGERWLSLSRAAKDQWLHVVGDLMALKMRDVKGSLRPINVQLTSDGKAEWERQTNAHAVEMNDRDFPVYLDGAWSKMKAYLARLALILQLLRSTCNEADTTDVEGQTMRDAAQLVHYFKAHAKRCYKVMGADFRLGKALIVLEWLMNNPAVTEFSRSDLWAAKRRTFLSTNPNASPVDLTRTMALLVEHRFLDPVEGGRPGMPRAGDARPRTASKSTHSGDPRELPLEAFKSIQTIRLIERMYMKGKIT